MKEVDELVEYMAESLRNTVRMESRCVFESPMSVYKDRAKQILSHPDLAIKGDRGFHYLADLLKEKK